MVGDVCAPWFNEAYTTIQLPASASRKGTASLHVKVDTRAGGNVLALCIFQLLYPNQISPAGLPLVWITSAPDSLCEGANNNKICCCMLNVIIICCWMSPAYVGIF